MPSRIENILAHFRGDDTPLDPTQSRIEEVLIEILENGGGGGAGTEGTPTYTVHVWKRIA